MASADPGNAATAAQKMLKIENTQKRDALVEVERKYQKVWAESGVFESNAPAATDASQAQQDKYFATIAYPYMNGSLHAGHGYTISKVEFATGYARLQGKNALFPLGFHCTGMAIKACADKLVREVEMFGQNFERYTEDDDEEGDVDARQAGDGTAATDAGAAAVSDVTKFRSKKTKAVAKSGAAKYQFQIMLSQGIPREDIHKFADAYHWVHVFPAAGIRDASRLGLRVDWRRSFVTTDANPFYDSFVRWQMNRLKELGKIKFGKRYTIYSPKDGQPCLDHDRSEGEGVGIQDYTGIKMKVVDWPEAAKTTIQKVLPPNTQANVYFLAATLRPETMYGQTCCFVGPKITYGLFKLHDTAANPGADNDYVVCTERAARNLAFQGYSAVWGETQKFAEFIGADLIGTLLDAPLSVHKSVRVLPMETAQASKGTGVVTCVPSDSPDDYATVIELAKKADYYKIQKEWATLEVIPIIETPNYGKLTAPALVEKMKIVSPKDPKLPEAKNIAYKEGFYNGTMVHGEFSGRPVQQAKDLVKQKLFDLALAFPYAEPEGIVISRSKDECVAAHLDQWYLNYGTAENGGDGEWNAQVRAHLQNEDGNGLNTFSAEAKRRFEEALDWLGQWACARSYGLGSKLPWDDQFLVESLSDSTIYPAYYTIAHYFHRDIYGKEPGLANIRPEQMTDEAWDFVLARTAKPPSDSDISLPVLNAMRHEFQYWYPLDLRVSGKDLIQNHLTFFLYIHVALWPSQYWPRGVRVNGFVLLNGEKMAKSTGNFLTLRETVDKFGADAARVALADAGDAVDDANFSESVANAAILKLYELRQWIEDMILGDAAAKDNKDGQRSGPLNFWDTLFDNEMNRLVWETKEAYDAHLFRAALRSGFYNFTGARDVYRDAVGAIGMHSKLVRRYAELQCLLLGPVAPHWCEYIWTEVLGHKHSIQVARWPNDCPRPDRALQATADYEQTTTSAVMAAWGQLVKRLVKSSKKGASAGPGQQAVFDPRSSPFRLRIFFTESLPGWQERCIDLVTAALKETGLVDTDAIGKSIGKTETKRAMPFIQQLKKRLQDASESAGSSVGKNDQVVDETEKSVETAIILGRRLQFDEATVLEEISPRLKKVLGTRCEKVDIVRITKTTAAVSTEEGQEEIIEGYVLSTGEVLPMKDLPAIAASAAPGIPKFTFEPVN
ncbi:putative leucyl-tRNA synthetase [Rosellinia necatrix]|uniref:leucine--tRNA ligase n=1 Tax=Rosellinia necatrix TaxID=77044 RepID=A0A1W2TEG2_ROSNE|nr:putative leucyl-tRNA synthetase [Rosellinia necatrix]